MLFNSRVNENYFNFAIQDNLNGKASTNNQD